MNPYRVVEGKMPSQKEMSGWGHDRWLDFLRFCEFFLEEDKYKEESYKVTKEKREMLEEMILGTHVWSEFIYRIGLWMDSSTERQFYYKLAAMVRLVLTYLKRHPALVDDEIRKMIEKHPKRMGWVLRQYKLDDVNGVPSVSRDTRVMDGNKMEQTKLPSLQVKIMNSMIKIADYYEIIANSLSAKEIKRMSVMDKVKALKDLHPMLTSQKNKIGSNHFTQININQNNAKALEESMLSYIKQNEK